VPLLNTIILIIRGSLATLAHIKIQQNFKPLILMVGTIFLGVMFSIFQGIEYVCCSFSIREGVYGSMFFILTGFHGAHVMLGVLGLFISLVGLANTNYTNINLISFDLFMIY
jgi:cytochrome c oxidase subunit 3